MATNEYTDLQGNAVLLKAVEYLRMLPEWKSKPGKLRTGHVEYCELIARHLVNLYCNLEGKTVTEKIELNEVINPLNSERTAQFQLDAVDADFKAYSDRLNEWHLKLSVLRDVVDHVFDELQDVPDWMQSTSMLCKERFLLLLETCPFPDLERMTIKH